MGAAAAQVKQHLSAPLPADTLCYICDKAPCIPSVHSSQLGDVMKSVDIKNVIAAVQAVGTLLWGVAPRMCMIHALSVCSSVIPA